MSNVSDRLDIQKGLTAVIGSGGKTTLINHLASVLDGCVIVATSTHIYPPEGIDVYTGDDAEELREILSAKRVVCAGRPAGAKLTAPDISFEELKQLADYVLTEADGSKGLPLKAHEDYEPVIPPCADRIILMTGASGFGRPAPEAVHRYEIFADVWADRLAESGGIVTPEIYAASVAHEAGRYAAKHAAGGARLTVLLNQADGPAETEAARRFAVSFRRSARDSKYLAGTEIMAVSLHSDNIIML